MRDSEGFLQPDWVSLSSYQSGIVINGPHICNGTVIHVHNNSLEVAWVPTGTDQGKIKPCLVHRRLSELVPAASRHPGKTIGTGTQTEAGGQVRRQREAPGEHEPGPSWSQPCLFSFSFFALLAPHSYSSRRGRDVIKTIRPSHHLFTRSCTCESRTCDALGTVLEVGDSRE